MIVKWKVEWTSKQSRILFLLSSLKVGIPKGIKKMGNKKNKESKSLKIARLQWLSFHPLIIVSFK